MLIDRSTEKVYGLHSSCSSTSSLSIFFILSYYANNTSLTYMLFFMLHNSFNITFSRSNQETPSVIILELHMKKTDPWIYILVVRKKNPWIYIFVPLDWTNKILILFSLAYTIEFIIHYTTTTNPFSPKQVGVGFYYPLQVSSNSFL
jgi:hypothetical protein